MKKNRKSNQGEKFVTAPLENHRLSPLKIAADSQISNRHTPRLETRVTHSKQTTAPRSNRHIQRGTAHQTRRIYSSIRLPFPANFQVHQRGSMNRFVTEHGMLAAENAHCGLNRSVDRS
jgi:hypothetical protein